MIKIKFPDGSVKEFPKGVSGLNILNEIDGRLKKEATGIKVNGDVKSLPEPILNNAEIKFLTFDEEEGRDVFWHSSAHLMAHAVKRLFPETKFGIGPPIEDGFYYDIDLDHAITPEDFEKIEAEMKRIVDEDLPIRRKELKKEEAVELFRKKDEDLKLDLIDELEDGISIYSQGDFIDLCRGPHLPSTGKIGKNFKLLSVAGAYWRGDEHNKMLQRLYATAYPRRKMLEEHLHRLEEAKKRDHRKLGRELDLFSIQEQIGNGLILWHPKGARIRRIMEEFTIQEHYKNGYELIYTPHIAKLHLWETSGHTGFYQENMFSPMDVEEVDYQLKPMNCPFHIMIYKNQIRSYRDLPIRLFELGTVYRYERSGVLHGLMRVRGFTQDDAHIFCTPKNLNEEISRVLNFTLYILRTFGFSEYEIFLSTRPEKFVGQVENWDKATEALKYALEKSGLQYKVDPGEGVFYGPKIDIKIRDSLGRSWQCSTIQVDFNLPERFTIEFIGEDGNPHQPIMIHRALMGSVERFFGVLIEHYAGAFPIWLAPVQAEIIPIAERHHDYARQLKDRLLKSELRVEADLRNEKVGYKIREAELNKIPYMIIVGDQEVEKEEISVRQKGKGDLGKMKIAQFLSRIEKEISDKE
ncbi:MAG: threonine--tRNA ligase [Calditrichaeota bacterium]|nr:threonine--tRNA ligase [Calditrichota bacterium]RQV92836.1 MAG: threonine--tRNA ligase [bacterium]RQW01051.1 MAG: threonine--tRNA ligase [Calditrichota bacterium]